MSQYLQPSIILLKEGTDTSQGIPQLVSNINACVAVANTIRTTLGPSGMDKLVYSSRRDVTISNDGATVMRLLDIVHPAARTLVDVARSQDDEVGDGTTSVVLLSGEFLKEAKAFVEEGVHPTIIIAGYQLAANIAKKHIREIAIAVGSAATGDMRNILEKCAATAMNSKLINHQKALYAKMVVDAVMHLDDAMDLSLIGVKKEKGGSLEESQFVQGVAFKKTFSYAGFEQQPKSIDAPLILCLNVELELKAEKDNAEVRVSPDRYQEIVNAEWNVIYDKLNRIVESGATVVFSKLAIGDLATQFFADRGIFSAGRVPGDDLVRVCKATGAVMQSTVSTLTSTDATNVLGKAEKFEEKQVGGARYNFITGCVQARTATIILRGGGEQFLAETERSVHDAVMIVRRARKHSSVVGGGGAIEMELSKVLRNHAWTITDKTQLIVLAYARALEMIPRQIADNAGFDSTAIVSKLRQSHHQGNVWFGVDVEREDVCDTIQSFVWEPSLVKLNAITAATEAACQILSIDETIKNERHDPQGGA